MRGEYLRCSKKTLFRGGIKQRRFKKHTLFLIYETLYFIRRAFKNVRLLFLDREFPGEGVIFCKSQPDILINNILAQ